MFYSMRRIWLSGIGLAVLTAFSAAALAEEPTARKRVLIVTGEDHKGHKWAETTPVLKAQLAKDSRLAVEVNEDMTFLRSPGLHDFDAVVMHFKNYDPEVPGS